MKKITKLLGIVLILALVMSMGVTAFADPVEGTSYTYAGTDATTDGKITVTNATKGETYHLYKIFDATYSGNAIAYTIKAGALKTELETNGQDYFTIGATADANGNFSVTRTGAVDSDTGSFVPTKSDAELIDYLKTLTANFTEIGEGIKSTTDGSIVFDKIPYGYYYVTSTLGAIVSIDSANPSKEIIDKNQVYKFDKNIIESDGSKVKVNDAMLNEAVDFRIEVNATNYNKDKKITNYLISDALDLGMTYVADSLVVKVGDTPLTAGTDYTLTYYKEGDIDGLATTTTTVAEAQGFELVIKWTQDGTKNTDHRYASNSVITVDYKAFLDPGKRDQIVFGGTTDANTNTARVRHFEDDDTTPKGELPDKKTDTFVTELTILKQDDNGNALKGAEFTLTGPTGLVIITVRDQFVEDETNGTYYLLTDGTYTLEPPTGNTEHDSVYVEPILKYSKTTETVITGNGQTATTMKATVGDDGKVTFRGLVTGTYKLVETVVPPGFNKIDDIDFTVTFTATEDTSTQTGYSGKFSTNNDVIKVETNNTLKTTIVNYSGTVLPSTGGIGTTIFYVVGSILVVAAGVLLITKKRMTREG